MVSVYVKAKDVRSAREVVRCHGSQGRRVVEHDAHHVCQGGGRRGAKELFASMSAGEECHTMDDDDQGAVQRGGFHRHEGTVQLDA
jgi:hypothetical protein